MTGCHCDKRADAVERARPCVASIAASTSVYSPNGRFARRVVFDRLGTRTVALDYDGHDRIIEQNADRLITGFELDGLDRPVVVTERRDG